MKSYFPQLLNRDALAAHMRTLTEAYGGSVTGKTVLIVSPAPVLVNPAIERFFGSQSDAETDYYDVESWHMNRGSFYRFLLALRELNPRACVFLSGDVHYSYVMKCVLRFAGEGGYPGVTFWQCTSSSLKNYPTFGQRRGILLAFDPATPSESLETFWRTVPPGRLARGALSPITSLGPIVYPSAKEIASRLSAMRYASEEGRMPFALETLGEEVLVYGPGEHGGKGTCTYTVMSLNGVPYYRMDACLGLLEWKAGGGASFKFFTWPAKQSEPNESPDEISVSL